MVLVQKAPISRLRALDVALTRVLRGLKAYVVVEQTQLIEAQVRSRQYSSQVPSRSWLYCAFRVASALSSSTVSPTMRPMARSRKGSSSI